MSRWIKRIGYTLGGLVALALVALCAVYALSEWRFRRSYTVRPEQVAVSTDSAVIARGEHVVSAIAGCADCHGDGLKGNVMLDAPPMGRLVALNLTKGEGGVGAQLTPALIERAVRHGVGIDGRALRIMPADELQYLTDDDLRAVVSYVMQLPAVNNTLAPSHLMLLPRALMVAGVFPVLAAERLSKEPGKPMTVSPSPTAEYGAYVAQVGGCKGCHGPGLSGGKIPAGDPSWGPAANLTPSGELGTWTEAQFVSTLRTGTRPNGFALKDPMPWKTIGRMTDDELHALWLYLRSVPPREFGNR
ncbi:MAG: c-type cytochrome [Gemmatimonadaceae bacterium]